MADSPARADLAGPLDDDLALTAPWGFDLDEIAVPTPARNRGCDYFVTGWT
jgi:hypothetical protein